MTEEKIPETSGPGPAMEFLMTYGWAILVVLVAIGALAYFGVLQPPVAACGGLTITEAKQIAQNSECITQGGVLKEQKECNEGTKTLWIDLDIKRDNTEGCNPACVIDTTTKTAVINWRCTGANPEPAPAP